MLKRITPLFNKAADDGSDGGGGDAPPFTEAQLAVIGQTVNAAITSHNKRQRSLAEQVKEIDWGTMLKPHFDAYVAALPDDGGSGGGDDDDAGGKGKGGKGRQSGTDPAVAKQLQDLASKLEASEKRTKDAEEARAAAETQRAMDRATGELRNLLQPKVRPELLDIVVRDMSAQRTLKLGENGAATLTVKRAPYKGAPEQDDDLPLSEAVPLWLASDGAKVFLPAPGTNQTPPPKGGRGPQHTPNGGGGELPTDPAARTLRQLQDAGIDPSELLD